MGWLGLHVPEEYGGQGFGLPELLVVVEELGRVVAPGPFISTAVATSLLVELGSEAERTRWLPALCNGTSTAAVGLASGLACNDTQVAQGMASPVWGDEDADLYMLAVDGDLVVFERADVTSVEALPFLDPARPTVAASCRNSRIAARLDGGAAAARARGLHRRRRRGRRCDGSLRRHLRRLRRGP